MILLNSNKINIILTLFDRLEKNNKVIFLI